MARFLIEENGVGGIKIPKLEPGVQYTYLGNRSLRMADFIAIRDNPAQRDTERHAANARHLTTFDPHHLQVSVAVLPDGEILKLDGHSRAYIWERGLSNVVVDDMRVNVDLYAVADNAALVSLYSRFDSRYAVDTERDVLYSAIRVVGLNFVSPMMQKLVFGGAISRTFRLCARRQPLIERKDPKKIEHDPSRQRLRDRSGFSPLLVKFTNYKDLVYMEKLVEFFKEELVLFDATIPEKKDYTVAVIVAAIITLMRYPREAKNFWSDYNNDLGVKNSVSRDGVESVGKILADIRTRTNPKESDDSESVRRIVNCFENWRKGLRGFSPKAGLPRPLTERKMREYIEAGLTRKFDVRDASG